MTSTSSYEGYSEEAAAGSLIVLPKIRKYRCCSYTTTLMSYLLVAIFQQMLL